jgi:hypothetical protein
MGSPDISESTQQGAEQTIAQPRLLKKVQMSRDIAGRRGKRGASRTYAVRRSAAQARQRSRWAFFSSLSQNVGPIRYIENSV